MTRPHRQTQPRCRAGLPNTNSWSTTGRVTTEPAPTSAYSPMVLPPMTVTLAPIDAPRPTVVATGSQSVDCDRGYRSLVNTTPGPTKTSSARVTPACTDALFSILTRSPTRTSVSTNA